MSRLLAFLLFSFLAAAPARAITVTEPPDHSQTPPGTAHVLELGTNTFSGTVTTGGPGADSQDNFQVTVPTGMRLTQVSKTVTQTGPPPNFSGFVQFNQEALTGTGTGVFPGTQNGAVPYPLPAGTYPVNVATDLSTGVTWSVVFTEDLAPLTGLVLTPTAVITTSQWVGPTAGIRDNMINGSGLSGGGSDETKTHDADPTGNNVWHAGPSTGGIGGGQVGDPPFGAPRVNTQAVEFDLGADYDLTGAHVWNMNQSGYPGRGVKDVQILVSSSTSGAFTPLTTTRFDQDTNAPGLAAQIVPFSGATNVRRVRFAIQSAWSGLTNDYVGLSEVRFRGTASAPRTLVTNTSDSGPGSLRAAIAYANDNPGADTITFSDGTDGTGGTVDFTDTTPETINLLSALPELITNMTITGPGADKLTIRRPPGATTQFRIFDVLSTVNLSGLTLTGGDSGGSAGGGIRNGGTLTVTACAITGHTAGSSPGGGIYNNYNLTVHSSTISGNTAGNGGGVFSSTSGLSPAITLTTLVNTTLSGNTATTRGGGFSNNNGLSYLVNCTLTGNSAPLNLGAGVATWGDNTTRTRFANTLCAGNTGGGDVDFVGDATNSNFSLGGNLIGTGNSGANFPGQTTTAAASTILNTTLASNGGPTPTHALPPGSPALNTGVTANAKNPTDAIFGDANDVPLTTDQRGSTFLRAIDTVDVGAFESQTPVPPNTAPSFALPTGPAGEVWTPRDMARNWFSITSSSDGNKLAAVVESGQIYTSTDSGVTWTARETNRAWRFITSSADGSKLAAVVSNGQIYTSIDSGVTWTARESNRGWESITSSSDGSKLAAVVANGQIYTSIDSGVTWTARESNRLWLWITSSADGSKLAATVGNGQIYTSTDSGVSWTARDSDRGWSYITSSADGSKLAAVVGNGRIYTSADSGVTWTPRDVNRGWIGITSSADGSKLAALVHNGQIYTSTDSAVTWTPRESNRNWRFVASSADGGKLVAIVPSGQIYTSVGANAAVSVAAGSGAYTQAAFATAISPGPATESTQSVTFQITANTNNGLFTAPPALAPNGTLTFTPANTAGVATVTVTAMDNGGTANGGADTSAAQTFTITITASSNADLASLTTTAGALSHAFAAGTTAYTASVPNATTSVTVTPTVADANATVKVNTVTVASGTASGPLSLNVGANTITTVVTAQDGTTTKTYTLTVTRAPVLTGLVLTPTAVITTSQWVGPAAGIKENMINGFGLDGIGPVIDQKHDAASSGNNVWHVGPNAGGIPGGVTGNPPAVAGQAVEFDLGANYDLTGAHVWNMNQSIFTGRGVKDVDVRVSSAATGDFPLTPLLTTQFVQSTDTDGLAAQVVPFSGATNVRRVRFTILTAWTSGAVYVGLSEVRFRGTAVATVPGAPVIGTATAGNASASVAFTPPASNGGSAITGYTVTSSPGGITATGAGSPINVTGLTNGTAYTFTVTATNAMGPGSASAVSNSVTPTGGGTGEVTVAGTGFGAIPRNPFGGTATRDISFNVANRTGNVTAVSVQFTLSPAHPYVSDLSVQLIAPDGTPASVMSWTTSMAGGRLTLRVHIPSAILQARPVWRSPPALFPKRQAFHPAPIGPPTLERSCR